MKSIKTLVPDIYDLFRKPPEVDKIIVENFGKKLGQHIYQRLIDERAKPALRMSNLGTPCNRKLWYSINTPELAEALPPAARIKFLFGDILEEFLLFLAQLAGHKVEGQQDEVKLGGLVGHRDAIIDGQLVDAKSASTYSFKKFEDHTLKDDDSFGYITQLNSYLHGSTDDPLLLEKNKASFLVMDKTLGNICLDTYKKDKVDYPALIAEKQAMLTSSTPPEKGYTDVPEGKSGNRRLGVVCSYCPFKYTCWSNLRTFVYASKPLFLTHVERLPKVQEVGSGAQASA